MTFILTVTYCILAAFFASCSVWYIYWRFVKGIKPKKGKYRKIGHGSKFKRLFVDFPRQLMYDRLNCNPDTFNMYGIHILAGKQGCGKTLTLVYLLRWYQKMYPLLKVKTNFFYSREDEHIASVEDIVSSENGIFGEIDAIDEFQNWYNSYQSKDIPLEFMSEITYQRKQRKCIMGTSQVFERLAKPIREQTYMLYQPYTIAGCLTIVFKLEPIIKASDGNVGKKKLRGFFFFVHDNELRECYDTYRKIERMAKDGFKKTENRT
jgi:ATP-dependent Clp protease ATP-binding subunit ClpX